VSCVEIYGPQQVAPRQATIHFRGVDRTVGPITKYTVIHDKS
jgi:hypothetical protein